MSSKNGPGLRRSTPRRAKSSVCAWSALREHENRLDEIPKMRTVVQRVGRLEIRSLSGPGPMQRFRIIVRRLDREPGLENASCKRKLWPDGTLFELIRLDRSSPGRTAFSGEGFEAWI